ncbi:hypothetical protein BV898_16677 [Hypsibius exemplaris]|uniref:Uncharacterized protein n=1 Tax=Hypsibius exemplaris TaxID=2072580 RepID=A0A9X6RLH3_HYPEX|nr:hypothetical protein BV898_16677 [Hypsibius exemplaris]
MLQAAYGNEAMDNNQDMAEKEAMEVAWNNGSALESASLMDVASSSETKHSSFADGQRFPSWTACRTVEKWQKET